MALVSVLLLACTGARDQSGGFRPAETSDCEIVDSILTGPGWRLPVDMSGRVMFDVKQYRVQGRFQLKAPGDGNLTFEFTGTMAMGGHHEDVVVSFYDDTLRVLDRERGRFYEGEEAHALVSEGLDVDWDVGELLRRIMGRPPACSRLSSVSVSRRGEAGSRLEGRIDGERFRVDIAGRRVTEASWPVMAGDEADDRLRVTYDWPTGPAGAPDESFDELVAFLEGRRWRVILSAR